MALTRTMLKGLDLESDVIQKIIDAHMDTVEAKQNLIDEYKEKAGKYDALKTDYDKLKADSKTSEEWEEKFNKEHEAFEDFKKNLESEKAVGKVKDAYKKLLEDAKVGSKHIDAVMRVTDFKDMKLDKDGNLENADKLTESIKKDWSGFIVEEQTKGSGAEEPPTKGGKPTMTKEEISKIKDPIERQAKMKENFSLYENEE